MPASIGTLISARLATLHELETVYSVRDVHDMLEVLAVDGYNHRVVATPPVRK